MTEATVTIQMTETHARAVRDAIDLFTRIGLGQIEELAQMARDGSLVGRFADEPASLTPDDADRIAAYCQSIKGVLRHPRNGSFGIGAKIPPQYSLAYEVLKVVDAAITKHRNPTDTSVRSDGLIVRYSQLPAPSAAVTG